MKSERTNIVFTALAGMPFAIDGPGMNHLLQTNYARHYSHAPAALKKTFRTKHITPIANSHTKARRALSIDMHLRLDLMDYGSMYPVHKPVQHSYSRVACVNQPDLVTAFSPKRQLEELEPGVTLAADLVPGQGMVQQGYAGVVEPTGKSTCQRITAASVQA